MKTKPKADLLAGLAIFVLTCSIFILSPNRQIADSKYSMLVSESLLHHGTFTLDRYAFPDYGKLNGGGWGGIYHLEMVNGHVYYYLPPGSSILSLPWVAAMNAIGVSAANADSTYNPHGERIIQSFLASILMAAFACLVFLTSRLVLPLSWSGLIAFGVALGTQVLSTASRGLWSDTWGILLVGFVVYMLLAHECGRRRLRPMLLATLLAWSYFVRPTNSLAVVAVTAYIFLFYRPLFIKYIVAGMAWLVAFIAYSWFHFGHALPSYFLASRLEFHSFWIALATNLISPSRGLLIFVPVIIFVIYLLVRYARELPSRQLAILSLAIIVAHLIVVSGFPQWWAGHCFGPRFTTGLVPWFALLGILAIRARLAWREQHESKRRSLRWNAEIAFGTLLLVISVGINARGAMSGATAVWNQKPVNVDEQPERVWDWRHPQFLATRRD
jgi:small basic protein